jgi:predicted transcriptional regulator
MITAAGGATVPELQKATGLLPHTLRARISELVAAEKLDIERVRQAGVTTYRPSVRK